MTTILPGSIIPWLLGGLLVLAIFTSTITLKSWREAKRSPYFFLRVQAARKMQRYLFISAFLVLLTILTTAYSWRVPEDPTVRVALLRHAKPLPKVLIGEDLQGEASPATVEINLSSGPNRRSSAAEDAGLDLVGSLIQANGGQVSAALPEEYNQIEATTELNAKTNLGSISFSSDITDDYQAVKPTRRFDEGYFTLYGTFEYEAMANGMVWSWVWKHNGRVIDGGNQKWSYGADGPGYVYFKPEEGFQLGEYTLELWVNEELQGQANFMVSEDIAARN